MLCGVTRCPQHASSLEISVVPTGLKTAVLRLHVNPHQQATAVLPLAHLFPILFCLFEGRTLHGNACVVHQDVNWPQSVLHLIHDPCSATCSRMKHTRHTRNIAGGSCFQLSASTISLLFVFIFNSFTFQLSSFRRKSFVFIPFN